MPAPPSPAADAPPAPPPASPSGSLPAASPGAPRWLTWALPLAVLATVGLALWGADADTLAVLRGPRVLAGLGVGALLALAGFAMQVLLRNPLADPYVLGTSGGAAVGAVGALLLFGSLMWAGAALGALAAGAVLLLLARGSGLGGRDAAQSMAAPDEDASARLILTGAMLSAVLGALLTLLLTLTPDWRLRGAIFWLIGDLSGATGGPALLLLAAVLCGLCLRHARTIDRLMLGSEAAWLLGEPVAAARRALLVGACLATAASVAVAGAVGFVGLVVPQALRLAGVRTTRALAWMSALGGAGLVVLADLLARTVAWPLELPVGALMALIGAPMFIWLLARGAR